MMIFSFFLLLITMWGLSQCQTIFNTFGRKLRKELVSQKVISESFFGYARYVDSRLGFGILQYNLESLYDKEDSIEIRDKSKQLAIIDIALASKERDTPEYIQLDQKNKKFKFVRVPKFDEVPYPIVMEPNLVIEYYSR